MDKIAAGSASDRRDLFRESASRPGMNPANYSSRGVHTNLGRFASMEV